MNADFEEYKKTTKHIDYLEWAIKKCKKLDKRKTVLANTMILEDAYYILLDNPDESKSSAYMKLHHVIVGLGHCWAENMMMDLIN